MGEELLSSLDRPDPSIDERWAIEAEDRLAEFQAGRMSAISADDVVAEFDNHANPLALRTTHSAVKRPIKPSKTPGVSHSGLRETSTSPGTAR